MMVSVRKSWAVLAALSLSACATGALQQPSAAISSNAVPVEAQQPALAVMPANAVANPANWPRSSSPAALIDPATEAAIDTLLDRMTLQQKVGQTIQADIAFITPADLTEYPLGSLLAGGNSGPYGDERAAASEWDRMVREFRAVSMRAGPNGIAIPLIFGIDAVHGHNNLPGATVFPHNIGLGAARDPELIQRIGQVTAAEVAASGIEWTFAPTLAVPQDLRWGRAYEGYSSDPAIVAAYSTSMVKGLQGDLIAGQQLSPAKVAATAKHFLADGGTAAGKDQGDAQIGERELIDIHAAGYPTAINAGALTVMASFSSWNGSKLHGNRSLLTDVLRGPLGFTGFVVGDWNGHGQVTGCAPTDCPEAMNAGLDMYMAPDSWKDLFANTLASVQSGEIAEARLDEAVRRILRVKYKLGLMGETLTERTNLAVIGSPDHLAVAREAVAKSLVLLKNEGSVLPVKPGANVLVTGPGADSMAMQSGGWTIGWQGDDVTKADFPNGNTIWDGIDAAVRDAGGAAELSQDGAFTAKPDVAIVVFGEQPYAEFQGDIPDLDYLPTDGLKQLKELKAKGIPTVALFLSGRPMFTGEEMATADAFVAAWLPGPQGEGVADVLIAGQDGAPMRDFSGRLSFAWPAACEPGADALFPLSFGGSYREAPQVPPLKTRCALSEASASGDFAIYDRGLKSGITAMAGSTVLTNLLGTSGGITASAFDVAAQEDARRIAFNRGSELSLVWSNQPVAQGSALRLRVQIAVAPTGPLLLSAGNSGRSVDLASTMALAAGKGWRDVSIPLACLADGNTSGVTLSSEAEYVFELESIAITPQSAEKGCAGPF